MKKTNNIAIASMMALIMTVSLSAVTFAREAESGGGSGGSSGRSSTHVEIGDDHGGLRASRSLDDSIEIHRSSGLHSEIGDDHGGLRASGSSDDSVGEVHRSAGHGLLEDNGGLRSEVRLLDDNNNNRRGSLLSGSSNSGERSGELRQERVSVMGDIQNQMSGLLKAVEDLLVQLKKQFGL